MADEPEVPEEPAPHKGTGPPFQFHCDVTGCSYIGTTPQGLGAHRFRAHGITAGPPAKPSPKKEPTAKRAGNVRADDIAQVVLSQLFPQGNFPVSKLSVVLEWIAQTEEFLVKIRG